MKKFLFVSVYGDTLKNYEIVCNAETNVMYIVSNGVFTLLVNPDGTPMFFES